MRPRVLLATVLIILSTSAFPQKKKSNFPQQIVRARYVYVTAMDGDQFNSRVTPEDRNAISDVQGAIRDWGRYRLVFNPHDADISIVVRHGNIGSLLGGIATGRGIPLPGSGGIAVGEAGMPEDMLMVTAGGDDPSYAPILWRRTAKQGLTPPALRLLQTFRKEVENATSP